MLYQPPKRALNDPAFGQDDKPFLLVASPRSQSRAARVCAVCQIDFVSAGIF